jgi:hypothetical protein
VTLCLTVHRGAEDDRLLQQNGPEALRRGRILDLCQEALSQRTDLIDRPTRLDGEAASTEAPQAGR